MTQSNAMNRFVHNAAAIRREVGMTIQQLADEIGMERSQLSNILSGKNSPTLQTIERIADGLGCDVSDLVEKVLEPA